MAVVVWVAWAEWVVWAGWICNCRSGIRCKSKAPPLRGFLFWLLCVVVIPANATFAVMPVEAGIQALKGIARLARELKN